LPLDLQGKHPLNTRSLLQGASPWKEAKDFTAYHAQYQVLCTYDFETRVDAEGRHQPFSYAIIYVNIFDLSKSIQRMASSLDPKELLEWFLDDVIEMGEHHHALQCVDFADPKERRKAKIPEDLVCPFCLKETARESFEYNHSHFYGDNLNLHLNKWICKGCNLKCTLRQKPLKFYGHNASRFDNYLFMDALVNSPKFKGFEFLAKTESRFTQVTCNVAANSKVKLSFNDSRMLLTEG
jgi:hypothetical protein